MIKYNHQLREYNFTIETVTSHHKDKEGKYKKKNTVIIS